MFRIVLLLIIVFLSGCSKWHNSQIDYQNKKSTDSLKYFYNAKMWDKFYPETERLWAIGTKTRDTSLLLLMAEYKGAYFMNQQKHDSAYSVFRRAEKLAETSSDTASAIRCILNKAIIQKNIHDYSGSEISSFKGLRYLDFNENLKIRASFYNNLGIIYNQDGDYKSAIDYHRKALAVRKDLKNDILIIHSLNNIGKSYKNWGKFDRAIGFFDQALSSKELLLQNDKMRAVLLDNRAHALMLSGSSHKYYEDFLEAIEIRRSIKDLNGIVISNLHLAEYFNKQNDTVRAIELAREARSLSMQTQNYRDLKESLLMLARLTPKPESNTYLNRYAAITDSLNTVQQIAKDQIARIEYELTRIEVERDRSKSSNQWLKSFVIGISLLVVAFYVFTMKKRRNKLRLERIQKEMMMAGFQDFLRSKYNLSPSNIEFWSLWAQGMAIEKIADKLNKSVEAIRSRRTSLRKKLEKFHNFDGDFNQTRAVIIYNDDFDLYKSTNSD